ncbi:MAG: hypothetical protein ABI960_02555 [Candidatus Eisenbacteria bacterium]
MGYEPVEEFVEVPLTRRGEGTRVRFRHEGAFGVAARAEHEAGWKHELERLLGHLEEGP